MSNGLNDLPADQTEMLVVEAIASFRGQPGEGQSGYVRPGDVLVLDRRRAAELRANGLVRNAGAADAGGTAKAARTVSVSAANGSAVSASPPITKPKGKAP